MIQRIQTVYLGVSLVLGFLLYYFSFYHLPGSVGGILVSAANNWYLLPAAAIIILAHIVIIFMYNRRKLQARACGWLMVLLALYVVLGVGVCAMRSAVNIDPRNFRLGAVLPVVMLVLVWLARKGIIHDESLVRSMDRLR